MKNSPTTALAPWTIHKAANPILHLKQRIDDADLSPAVKLHATQVMKPYLQPSNVDADLAIRQAMSLSFQIEWARIQEAILKKKPEDPKYFTLMKSLVQCASAIGKLKTAKGLKRESQRSNGGRKKRLPFSPARQAEDEEDD